MSTHTTWNRNTARQARRGVASIIEAETPTHDEFTVILLPGKPVTDGAISAVVWQAEKHLSPRRPGRCLIKGSWTAAQTQSLAPNDLLPLLESTVPELRLFGNTLLAQVSGAPMP